MKALTDGYHSLFKSLAKVIALSLVVFLAACSDSDDDGPTTNIVETAAAAEGFTTLVAAVEAAGLVEALSGEGPFTVFAPTDDAFTALLNDLGLTAEELLADTDLLTAVLTYHVVSGEVGSAAALEIAASDMNTVDTLNESAQLALSTSTENDAAVLYINTSRVTQPDIATTNGVIHQIDKVILPPMPNTDNEALTIAEIVTALAGAAEPEFTTLLAAVGATSGSMNDVAAILSDTSQTLTVFAPTDAAFATLLADLGTDATTFLADVDNVATVLLQHALAVEVDSIAAYAANGSDVASAGGANLTIEIQNNALFVEGSQVIQTDIIASNGIIHVIDAVIAETD